MKNRYLKILFFSLSLVFISASCQMPWQKQVQQTEAEIHVTQSVQQQKSLEVFTYKASEHKTALDMLKSSYDVGTKSFGSAGEFVERIGLITPDKDYFWAFYVNGKSSNVGAGSYELKDGDSIEWKLEYIKK